MVSDTNRMDTITQRRYLNARTLMSQAGGGPVRFAERLSTIKFMSKQQASHVVGERPVKGIGHDLARRIELAYGMKPGWLDQDHSAPPAHDPELIEVAAIAGHESALDAAQAIRMRKDWIRQNINATAFANLALLTLCGDSMDPTITDGSLLLVDQGLTTLGAEGIYVLAKDQVTLVRRVQRRLEGGFIVKCDNPSYESSSIEDQHKAGILVLGRVLLAWCARKL